MFRNAQVMGTVCEIARYRFFSERVNHANSRKLLRIAIIFLTGTMNAINAAAAPAGGSYGFRGNNLAGGGLVGLILIILIVLFLLGRL